MKEASLEVVANKDALIQRAADWIEALLRTETNDAGLFSFVLAGGSTPGPVYVELEARHRAKALPWGRIAIYFGDERCVPAEDPESNYRTAFEALIDPIGIENFGAVHRMRGEAADAEAEAERYADLLPDTLDLVVLGVGEDGHTASLFPMQPSLFEEERKVLSVIGPKPPPQRLSLSPVPILDAQRVLVLASGEGKAEALALALNGEIDVTITPIQLARHSEDDQVRHWILDEAAAAKVERE